MSKIGLAAYSIHHDWPVQQDSLAADYPLSRWIVKVAPADYPLFRQLSRRFAATIHYPTIFFPRRCAATRNSYPLSRKYSPLRGDYPLSHKLSRRFAATIHYPLSCCTGQHKVLTMVFSTSVFVCIMSYIMEKKTAQISRISHFTVL